MNEEREQPYGLSFAEARAAGELETGQIVVFDGHVAGVVRSIRDKAIPSVAENVKRRSRGHNDAF